MLTRSFSRRVSNPPSHSVDVSGLRSGLPKEFSRSPGVSTPLTLTVGAVYVMNADVDCGCTPDAPYALRTRNWLRNDICGKNGSSDRIQDTLPFGYMTRWKFVPNALFSSERTASVRKSRSRKDACSWR